MFISCFHKLQTFQFENVFHHLGIADISRRGVGTSTGKCLIWCSVHFCELRHVIENSNYFFLKLWINAGFFECHSFILVDVICHCCKASLLLLFLLILSLLGSCCFDWMNRAVFCSHSWFVCNMRCLIIFLSSTFFSISQRYSFKLVWSDFFLLLLLQSFRLFPSLLCFGRLLWL